MTKEIWCAGCNEVKGEMEEDLIKMLAGPLGYCPKCETRWILRDKK